MFEGEKEKTLKTDLKVNMAKLKEIKYQIFHKKAKFNIFSHKMAKMRNLSRKQHKKKND